MTRMHRFAAVILLCLSTFAGAQSFQEGFFLQNYRQAYRYNPALTNASGFIGIGEVNVNSRANIGAAAFLYPREQGLVTALHPSVTSSEFFSQLKNDNYSLGAIDANLFAYGFRTNRSYHTLEAGVRALYGYSAPKELFQFLKSGSQTQIKDLNGLGGYGQLFAELAYGYGIDLGDFISLGVRAKVLIGLFALDANIDQMNLSFSTEAINAAYTAAVSVTKEEKWRKQLPKGIGGAFDFGVAIRPVEGLTISASILDVGGIFWDYAMKERSAGAISFTGINNLTYEELNTQGLLKRAMDLAKDWWKELEPERIEGSMTYNWIPFQVNVGVKYAMPFYDRLTAGIIGQYTGYGSRPYWDARFGLEINPIDWLDITGNFGKGKYGLVYGVAGSIRLGHFRVNAGLQNGFGGTIPYEGTPLKPNSKTLTFGLTYDL